MNHHETGDVFERQHMVGAANPVLYGSDCLLYVRLMVISIRCVDTWKIWSEGFELRVSIYGLHAESTVMIQCAYCLDFFFDCRDLPVRKSLNGHELETLRH